MSEVSPVATIKELHDAAQALDTMYDATAVATLKTLVDADEAIRAAFAAFDAEKAAHDAAIVVKVRILMTLDQKIGELNRHLFAMRQFLPEVAPSPVRKEGS